MANYGKRMVPEYLIKTLEGVDKKIQGDADNINLMENIKDLNGNKRFIESDGEVIDAVEGVEITFTKLSLSGTHLMAVVAGVINNATELDATHRIKIDFNNVPSWILDKMVGVSSSYPDIIDIKSITVFSDDFASSQSVNFYIGKDTVNNKITLRQQKNLTTTAKRIFRVQFDLLIDDSE